MLKQKSSLIIAVFAMGVLSACTVKHNPSIIKKLEITQGVHSLQKTAEPSATDAHRTAATSEVNAVVTFKKSEIFNQEFLYGADVQHSSIFDEDSKLFGQVYTQGHEIAFFRKLGNQLQLLVDERAKYESDVNHPERLINSFTIQSEDENYITVAIAQGSPVLQQAFGGDTKDITRTSWLRSIEFVPDSNLLLMESSVENLKGDIVEHMESLFPRQNLIKDTATPLILNEKEPLAERFRFLSWFEVFRDTPEGRSKAPAAFRFNLAPGKNVHWYITSNIPDDILPDVKNSVEGWNRYFQKMWGQDAFVFEGKLPAGAKLGDPRYNVIVWDSVADGNAAYESQAVDPITGIQSHSNIYIPNSWLKTGTEYWENGQYALSGSAEKAKAAFARKRFFDRPLNITCVMDTEEIVPFSASPEELRKAGREVLKAVIMHEVGHALGMAHNFKGSLGYNAKDIQSTSIMDYNFYFLESKFFDRLDGATGPLLSYDQQFLTALYNKAQGLETAPVLPTCDDGEADSQVGGIDPFCTRYDAGSNPIEWMEKTRALIESPTATLDRMVNLSEALKKIPQSLGPATEAKSAELLTTRIEQFTKLMLGTVNFYISDGAQSLRYTTSSQLKSLKVFKPNTLDPLLGTATDIRSRVMTGLKFGLGLSALPTEANTVYQTNWNELKNWLAQTPYYVSLKPDDQQKQMSQLTAKIEETEKKIFGDLKDSSFAKLRNRLAKELTRNTSAPYEFSAASGTDYEAEVVALLAKVVSESTIGTAKRSTDERITAAKSLKSFADSTAGAEALEASAKALQEEIKTSANAVSREKTRQILKLLLSPDLI